MNGNSGNSHSKVVSRRQFQLGPTVNHFSFNLMNFNLFSNNRDALNRTFKYNSSKMLFALAMVFLIMQLLGGSKKKIKFSCK